MPLCRMTHNEFRHNGSSIDHRSLAAKNLWKMDFPVVSTHLVVLSVSWILRDITKPQATAYTAQVILSRKLWEIEII